MRSRTGATSGAGEGSGTGIPMTARRASTSNGLFRTSLVSAGVRRDPEGALDGGAFNTEDDGPGFASLTHAERVATQTIAVATNVRIAFTAPTKP